MNYIQVITVIATVLIGGASIWVNLKSIQTNKDIAKENRDILEKNAGKNRIIYGIEEVAVSLNNPASLKRLNDGLNTASYTILNVLQNSGNNSELIYTIGKINP